MSSWAIFFTLLGQLCLAQDKSKVVLTDDQGREFAGLAGFNAKSQVDGVVKPDAILSLVVKAQKMELKISAIEIWHFRDSQLLDFKRINYDQAQTPHQLKLTDFNPATKKNDYIGIQVELSDKTQRQFGIFLE